MRHELVCSDPEQPIAGFRRLGFTVRPISPDEIEVSGNGWNHARVQLKPLPKKGEPGYGVMRAGSSGPGPGCDAPGFEMCALLAMTGK